MVTNNHPHTKKTICCSKCLAPIWAHGACCFHLKYISLFYCLKTIMKWHQPVKRATICIKMKHIKRSLLPKSELEKNTFLQWQEIGQESEIWGRGLGRVRFTRPGCWSRTNDDLNGRFWTQECYEMVRQKIQICCHYSSHGFQERGRQGREGGE